MLRVLFFGLIIVLVVGCSATKTKRTTDTTKIERELTTRPADTLNYVVPRATYKDTIIYVKNFEKQGSNTLRIAYDNSGNAAAIDCISEEINELKETIINTKQDEKIKEKVFKDVYFIYLFLGLALLVFVSKSIKGS